jgi:RNA polymerase sigma-70 factor (ECF subfamily)
MEGMRDLHEVDDRTLIHRARRDPDSFGVLFDRHAEAIHGYIFRRTADWDLARDLTSEVFLKAYRSLWRYRWSGVPVSAWLYAIATNEIRMAYRRRKRAPSSLDALRHEAGFDVADPSSLAAERAAAERELERHAQYREAVRAMTALPIAYQEALSLRYFEQKSVAEIAQILGRREGTVKSLLSRGMARLRILLPAKPCNLWPPRAL